MRDCSETSARKPVAAASCIAGECRHRLDMRGAGPRAHSGSVAQAIFRQSLHCVLAALAVVAGIRSACAGPQSDSAGQVTFAIPAQSLPTALMAFSKQAHIQVLTGGGLSKEARAQEVKGRMPPRAALSQLLQGTRLTFVFTDEQTVVVKPAASSPAAQASPTHGEPASTGPPHTLKQIDVTSSVLDPLATRANLPLRRIPQSISILDRQQLDQQNLTSLADTFDYATGTVALRSSFPFGTTLYSRGFPVTSYHVDGSAPLSWERYGFGAVDPDLAEYDRIEILRGIDALFGGAGNPSASVVLWRKRASGDSADSITQLLDARGRIRSEADVGGALSYDRSLRGRAVVAYDDRPEFYGPASSRGTLLFGTIEYDLSPATTLDAGMSYQLRRALPMFSGLPRYIDGSDAHLPRSEFFGVPWNRTDSENAEAFVQLEHRLSDGWKFNIDLAHFIQKATSSGVQYGGGIDPTAHDFQIGAYQQAFSQRASLRRTTAEIQLTGNFEIRGRTIEAIAGMDFERERSDLVEYVTPPSAPSLPIDENYRPSRADYRRTSTPLNLTTQQGFYTALRFNSADDRLHLSGGIRWNRYVEKGLTVYNDVFGTTDYPEARRVQHFLGGVYDLSHSLSVYGSFAETYGPQYNAQTAEGGLIGPSHGTNAEVGLKGEWASGAITASLGAFEIHQFNVAELFFSDVGGGFCCYLARDGKSTGFETELKGRISEHWNVRVGYALQTSGYEQTPATDGATLSTTLNSRLPRQRLNAWLTYRPREQAETWDLSLGLRAQTHVAQTGISCPSAFALSSCGSFQVAQQTYAVADLRFGYQFNATWTASVAVTNLLDRRYYQTIGLPQNGNWYGDPRNVTLSIRKILH